jgi:hypothetical protein
MASRCETTYSTPSPDPRHHPSQLGGAHRCLRSRSWSSSFRSQDNAGFMQLMHEYEPSLFSRPCFKEPMQYVYISCSLSVLFFLPVFSHKWNNVPIVPAMHKQRQTHAIHSVDSYLSLWITLLTVVHPSRRGFSCLTLQTRHLAASIKTQSRDPPEWLVVRQSSSSRACDLIPLATLARIETSDTPRTAYTRCPSSVEA